MFRFSIIFGPKIFFGGRPDKFELFSYKIICPVHGKNCNIVCTQMESRQVHVCSDTDSCTNFIRSGAPIVTSMSVRPPYVTAMFSA